MEDSQQNKEEFEAKVGRLKQLVNNYGSQDIRERMHEILKK